MLIFLPGGSLLEAMALEGLAHFVRADAEVRRASWFPELTKAKLLSFGCGKSHSKNAQCVCT